MKPISVLISALSFSLSAGAQPTPDTLWARTYGGIYIEYAHSVEQTTDGGYIVAGSTTSFGAGSSDFYLVKTDSQGDTLWTRTYGGSSGDKAYSVQQTADGGYVVAGSTESFGGGEDFYLVKTNNQGDTVWTRTYGGSNDECAYAVRQTTDGGYIVAGETWSLDTGGEDFYLVKTDGPGDTLWTRTYGGIEYDLPVSVQQTTDGGYVVAGYTLSFGAGWEDLYLVKMGSQGDTLWTRTYGGSNHDRGYSVQQTTDGGYIVAGYTRSLGAGLWDFYLVKTDSQGDTLWTRAYGGSRDDYALSVQQTSDGGYVVTGYTQSFGAGSSDFCLVKANSQGDTLWTRTYGGNADDRAFSIQQTADGGYIVAGHTFSFGAGSADFYLVKTGPDQLDSEPIKIGAPSQYILHPNFPNPFNASTQITYTLQKSCHVTLTVFNLLGDEIITLADEVQSAGLHTVYFDGSGLASGVYLYRLQTEEFMQTRKMVLLK